MPRTLLSLAASLLAMSTLLPACVEHHEHSDQVTQSAKPAPTSVAADVRSVDVCVGARHACALDNQGNVACWGDNDHHEVDASSVPQIESPKRIDGLGPVEHIACGASETCAAALAGGLRCWGGIHATPTAVPIVGHPHELAMVSRGGCAIIDGGKIECFDPDGREPSAVIDGIVGARKLGAMPIGGMTVCALRTAGPPVCFDASFRDPAPKEKAGAVSMPKPQTSPKITEHPELDGALDVAVIEDDRVCGVFSGGAVRCSGGPLHPFAGMSLSSFSSANNHVGCGITIQGGATCTGIAVPQDAVIAKNAGDFGCGTTRSGGIVCWGAATYGELGDGTRYFRAEPMRVPGIDDAVSLSVGKSAACVARKSGKLTCWGRVLDNDVPSPPHDIATTEPVKEVVLGQPLDASRPCARSESGWKCRFGDWIAVPPLKEPLAAAPKPRLLTTKGHTWEWAPWSKAPEPDFFAKVGLTMKQISQDGYCGIDVKGRLACGHCGACSDAKAALTVVAGDGFTLAASLTHNAKGDTIICGVRHGRPACLAANDVPWNKVKDPVELSLDGADGFADTQMIASTGGRYDSNLSCVLNAHGEVGCWGDDRFLQLGGSSKSELTIATIRGLPPVVEVGSGGSFACARTSGGEVYCWGGNRDGGAPDDSALNKPTGAPFRLK